MADIANTLSAWSTTRSSNSPSGATTIGTGLDDNLRELQGVVRGWLASKGADIASATTTDLGAIEGLFHDITGSTTITGLGTVSAGIWKIIKFEGILTLTHNATSLILPGAANITTAVGDMAMMTSEGSGNWRCNFYSKADGSETAAVATQAQMEAGTNILAQVTPGRQHFHPGHPKMWERVDIAGGTPSIQASYNVTSLTDNGVGDVTTTLTTAMSGTNNAPLISPYSTSGFFNVVIVNASQLRVNIFNTSAVAADLPFSLGLFGDI